MADEVNAAENVAETEEQIHYPLHVQYCGGNIVNLRSGESFLEGICAYWIDFFVLLFMAICFAVVQCVRCRLRYAF